MFYLDCKHYILKYNIKFIIKIIQLLHYFNTKLIHLYECIYKLNNYVNYILLIIYYIIKYYHIDITAIVLSIGIIYSIVIVIIILALYKNLNINYCLIIFIILKYDTNNL